MPGTEIIQIEKSDLLQDISFQNLVEDESRDYYVSLDWSPEFYVLQASRGFIAVAMTHVAGIELLLPQLQFSYCVLPLTGPEPTQWGSVLKRSRNKSYRIRLNHDFESTLNRLQEYHSPKSWLTPKYMRLMRQLYELGPIGPNKFQICSVELYNADDELVAGEIGYIIGLVFTSLSGFCARNRSESVGKVQIISLARLLRRCGFAFLNLGQPPHGSSMAYKEELGGTEVSRQVFLDMWVKGIYELPLERNRIVTADTIIDTL